MEALKTVQHTKWVLDPAHSELTFKVKHLMISNVKGVFKNFSAEINGEQFENSFIKVTIDPSSISTNDEKRDGHLKSADFFDVEKYNEINFKSSSISKVDDENYLVKGFLTMKGIIKEIQLKVIYGGTNKDPWGNEKSGYQITGTFNRKDWGLNWNAAIETGGVLVSDEVKIEGEVQFVRK
jgi:polyisoprenoid-binding protein YceI